MMKLRLLTVILLLLASVAHAQQTVNRFQKVVVTSTASDALVVDGTTSSGTFVGPLTGNAATATALQTPRTINGVLFDGTANILISSGSAAAELLTGTTIAANVVGSSLTSVGTLASLTVTAPIVGSVTGNAATATALQTGRAINGVTFDGTVPITVTAAAGTLTGTALNALVTGSSLTGVGTITSGTWSGLFGAVTGANLTHITPANIDAGTITATFSGNLTGNVTGTSSTATALVTPRAIYGNNFDGTAALTQIIGSAYGGTGSGFVKFSGPTLTEKTFTLPDSSTTILTALNTVTVAQGGTGATTLTGILQGGGTSAITAIALPADATKFLDGTGAFSVPSGTATAVAITDDTTTNAAMYPTWVTANTGGLVMKVSSTKFSFNPSTGAIASAVWNGGVIGPAYGGTGVANNAASTLTVSGNFATTFTVSGTTSVTLPTSGTLVNTAVTTLSSLASIGTITTGVWNAGAVTSSGLLSVNGFGTHIFSAGNNSTQILKLENTTSGTAAQSFLDVVANGGRLILGSLSTLYTTSGTDVADGARMISTGGGGLSIAATHASGAIRFYSGGTTQRAGFTSGGVFVVGTDLTSFGAIINVGYNPNTQPGMYINATANKAGGEFIGFTNASQVAQGSITATNSTTTAYNTSSDARLKNDLGVVFSTDVLARTVIHDFTWKADGQRARGIFAQDEADRAPFGAVHQGPNGYWSADYSKYVPDLIVGWQQHDARLAALEAKTKELTK